jgi:RluA family pseudouridine synthase
MLPAANERVTFKVHYEDRDVLVLEKPSGRVTQPGKGHDRDSLLNGLVARYPAALAKLGVARDFGLLHRLDKETSGLLVVALSPKAYDALREAFESREVAKFYWAITGKAPDLDSGVISKPIAETTPRTGEMKLARLSRHGKPAVTAFRVVHRSPSATSNAAPALIEARPLTGRLHQVRVHLESIGCPILGDDVYAAPKYAAAAPRLMLHSHRLAFKHPITGAMIDVHSKPPREMKAVLTRLRLPLPETPPAAEQG